MFPSNLNLSQTVQLEMILKVQFSVLKPKDYYLQYHPTVLIFPFDLKLFCSFCSYLVIQSVSIDLTKSQIIYLEILKSCLNKSCKKNLKLSCSKPD